MDANVEHYALSTWYHQDPCRGILILPTWVSYIDL